MMKGQGFVEYVLLFVLVVVVIVVLLALIGGGGSILNRQALSSEPTLGARLIFPEGWKLVGYSHHASSSNGSIYALYICESYREPATYRYCTPQIVEAE